MFTALKIAAVAFRADRRGVTAMEYGMIASATIVAIAVGVGSISTSLSSIFTSIEGAL